VQTLAPHVRLAAWPIRAMAACEPMDNSDASMKGQTVSGETDGTDEVGRWLRQVAPDLADDHVRMRRLLAVLDRYQIERWGRHVSAADMITDRWERARRMGFGEGTSIYDSALVIGDVRVGRNTWIGPATVLDGSGGLTIGDTCSISAGVQIYSHDSVMWAVTGGNAEPEQAPSSVGSQTYIGPSTIISKGVSVGSRCIIGASSLVLEDVRDGHVAYGTPAQVVEETDAWLQRRGPG
jgi:acetyltransferase-like isoleucine patch superfamily enzyme